MDREFTVANERSSQATGPARWTGPTSQILSSRGCGIATSCLVEITGRIGLCDAQNRDCPVRRQAVINNLERCGINMRFCGCSFANIEKEGIPASIREPYSQVKGYFRKMKENIEAGRGMLLKGSVGTMKTTLAVAVLLEYIALGGNGFFINMSGLLDNIFTSKARSTGEWAKFEQRLREIPLLVLDDLGAEHSEGWVLTKVDAIITERYNRCLPAIITTNMSTEQLRDIYAERVIDRLRSTMQVVTFSGQSLRPSETKEGEKQNEKSGL